MSTTPVNTVAAPPLAEAARQPVAVTTPEEPHAGEGAWQFVVGITSRMLVLFGLYTLSIGPMYWRWYSGKFVNGSRYVAAFYEPLWALAHAVPWFGSWLDFYVQLWGDWRL